MNILVVEDSTEDYFLLKRFLDNNFRSANVRHAKTINECALFLENEFPSVIILDYYLPDGTAFDFLSRFASSTLLSAVLVLTASDDDHIGRRVIESGAQDYLIKGSYSDALLKKSIEYSLDRLKNNQALLESERVKLSAMRVKDSFMSIMSHELLTPLTGIINGAQLLKDHLLPSGEALCEAIEISGENLHEKIVNILDCASMDAQEIELETNEIEIEELLEFTEDCLTHNNFEKEISFNLHISDDVPEKLYSDIMQIKQIIYNLISNAMKFTNEGEINVFFRMEGDIFEIEISDTGVGIDKDKCDIIFMEFSMVDISHARVQQGTGIGLSLVKKSVDLLGGSVEVESSPGEGSCFTVHIPNKPSSSVEKCS
ncbi:MAG: hybrid sensor histidine kinase/response regulator [Lentisphaeraceae bacterium]|nr:hybrid sensor histidine kinase/response regulator [Lentisphaeraceae bacterium]